MLKECNEIGIDAETFTAMLRTAFHRRVKETRFNAESEAGKRLMVMYAMDMIGRSRLATCWGEDIRGRRFVARWYKDSIEVIMEFHVGSNNFYVFDCDTRLVA